MVTVYKLPSDLEREIKDYENYINEYINGKIDKQKMRAYRVPMGVYEQRTNDTYMVRVRIPGGNIAISQFKKLIEIAKKYTSKDLHITTREEVQLHDIKLEDTVKIMKELLEIGLATRGGGGNTVRNVIGSYDSGISKNEIFDITPYVIALTERMIEEKDSWSLPRKFKIAFSNGPDDTGLATVNDLGFIAKINEKNEKGFSVFIAGGMGAKSNTGIKIFNFIPEREVYNITKATKILFDKYGNRKNKHKARLRFVLFNLGIEEFIKKFFEEYENVKNKNYKPLELKTVINQYNGFIEIPVFCGDLSFDNANKIIKIAEKFGEFSLRLTPRQNIIIKNISENRVYELKEKLIKDGLLDEQYYFLNNAISCAGASTCRLGICQSKNLLKAIKAKFQERNFKFSNIKNIKINISGCPNSCGQHLLADIGFFGKARKINDRYVPYYYVVSGAVIGEDKTKFAEKIGEIPAYYVPDFLYEFLHLIDENKKNEKLISEFINNGGRTIIDELIKKYSEKLKESKEEKIYFDWYDSKEFSVLEKVEGECSAGLFDLIDYDFSVAKEKINNKELREAIVYISRALLITKGLEIKDDNKAPEFFKKYFIGRHIDEKYSQIIDRFLNNDNDFTFDEIYDFYNAVKNLYEQMDNSLKFPEINKEEKLIKEKIIFKDFRGVPCPLNFVKTKLLLETIDKGETLKILLDDGEPIENVPASLISEGHKILQKNKIGNYWEVLIERG